MKCSEHAKEADLEVQERPRFSSDFTSLGQPVWSHDDFALEFTRVLATAQEGASTIAECILARSKIDRSGSIGWYNAWFDLAARSKRRGDVAFETGASAMAADNWLRAANYYRTAGAFLNEGDERQDDLIEKMRICSHLYLAHGPLAATVLNVAFRERRLEGYFIPASNAEPHPVVVCVGEMGSYKEDLLFSMRRHGVANGLSLLLVDPPDTNLSTGGRKGATSAPITGYISRWADHLLARDDIDPNRMAIYGDGLGACYATMVLKTDRRFAAAICDGGLWESKEWSFIARRSCGGEIFEHAPVIRSLSLGLPPMLTLIGARDYVSINEVEEIWGMNVAAGIDHDLKIFTADETGAGPSQIDNPTIAKEFAFGWLKRKLGAGPM